MTLEVGDTVAYTAEFVRNVGGLLHAIAERRGKVVELRVVGTVELAVVQWDDEDEPKPVRMTNICRVGTARMYA